MLFKLEVKHVVRFINDFESLRSKSGIIYAIRYMKTMRLHVTRYICKNPLKTNKDGVSLTKDYFPKRILYLKKLIDSNDVNNIRGVLSLLYYTRSVKPTQKEESKLKPDFSTITSNNKAKKEYTIPHNFIRYFVEKHKLKSTLPSYGQNLHYISSKASPYGVSTLNSTYEIFSLSNVHHSRLNLFLDLVGEKVYNLIFGDLIRGTWEDNRLFSYKCEPGSTGKLSIVKDPELKLRVIAILGYHTQFLLKPIHDNLLNLLRKFQCDRTFTQDPFNNWKPKGNAFHSLDLSAATDRFPISLQVKLLSHIYDERIALIWKDLLVKQSFAYGNSTYNYAVGQPMGAYSSWAAFTLTHHLVVEWAAYLSRQWSFKDYILLGDDIVINNDKVANKYKTIMTRLGVEISNAKSHVSYNTYEFAKRWIKSGVEVSPVPLRGIVNNFKNLNVVLMQLINYRNRINDKFNDTSLRLVKEIYKDIRINKYFLSRSKIDSICYKFYHSYRYSIGLATNLEMKLFLEKLLPDKIPVPSEELIPLFIRELLVGTLTFEVEKLAKSAGTTYKDFINYYKTKKLSNMKLLKSHPFTHALHASLTSSKKRLLNVNKLDNTNLIDTIVDMRLEKVDKLVQEFRDPTIKVAKLDKLWNDVLKRMKQINLEHESHWSRSPTLIGAGPPIGNQYFEQVLSDPLGKLDVLRYGILL